MGPFDLAEPDEIANQDELKDLGGWERLCEAAGNVRAHPTEVVNATSPASRALIDVTIYPKARHMYVKKNIGEMLHLVDLVEKFESF